MKRNLRSNSLCVRKVKINEDDQIKKKKDELHIAVLIILNSPLLFKCNNFQNVMYMLRSI